MYYDFLKLDVVMNMLGSNEYEINEFYKWLSAKFPSRQISIFVSVFNVINNHYHQNGYLKKNIFETSDIDTIKKIQDDVVGGKAFRSKYTSRTMTAYLGLSYYIQYLENEGPSSNDKKSSLVYDLKRDNTDDVKITTAKIGDEQSFTESSIDSIEDIRYTDLSTIILNNDLEKYKPDRFRYYGVQYKIDGWNDLYTKTVQLLKRDYPTQMSDIKMRLYGNVSDKAITQLLGYLKRCWVSDQDYEVACVLKEDFDKRDNSLKNKAITQEEQKEAVTAPEIIEPAKQEPKEWSLLEFFDSEKIKYIDKTQKGGCVWLIGGNELVPIVEECRKHGIYFKYSARGGLASGNKPAWWARLQKVESQISPEREAANSTIQYYEEHAKEFAENTLNADMESIRSRFLTYLPTGCRILDFGCGTGRDAKAFLDLGYDVTAIDGSEALCRIARSLTGIPVRCQDFRNYAPKKDETYEGIWACASLLHLQKDELLPVMRVLSQALMPKGAFYISFKYGTFEGERNGRHFTDFTPEDFSEFIKNVPELSLAEYWVTGDVRPGRGDERWLNIVLRRTMTCK